jgi:hypothetical protein
MRSTAVVVVSLVAIGVVIGLRLAAMVADGE